MSALVIFAGVNLITMAEGVATFPKPGKPARKKVYSFIPRSGVIPKDLGRGSAEHQLKICFTNVLPANIETLRSRLMDLHDPLIGPPVQGTLVLKTESGATFASYPNCVFDDYDESEMTRSTEGVSPADPDGTETYDLEFELKFVQTRR
jgi:hypothetical protein